MLHETGLVTKRMARVATRVELDWRERVAVALDSALDAREGDGEDSFADMLASRLDRLRAAAMPTDWVDNILPWVRVHQVLALARDRLVRPSPALSRSARDRALRTRHLTLANIIDGAAARVPAPHILALASDGLPELDWSLTVARGRIGRFVAAGRDRRAQQILAAHHGARLPTLEPMALSVRDVLRGGAARLGQFDAIYAADLVTTPPPATLAALVAKLFALLEPGGQLVLGALGDAAETCALTDAMAPALPVWRSAAAVAALAADIPRHRLLSRNVTATAVGASWYLDLRRV